MPRICPHFLWADYVSILLSEVEQEQRPSENRDRAAMAVGAGFCDGECERAYTAYDPHYNIFASRTNVFSFLEDVSATKTFRRHFCRRNVRHRIVAETSAALLSLKRLSPKRPGSLFYLHRYVFAPPHVTRPHNTRFKFSEWLMKMKVANYPARTINM